MKKIIIANHKMNLNFLEMKKYIEILNKYKDKFIVCPSNIYIPYFVSENFKVGIQNIYKGNYGPYTGEVSACQAKSIGVNYVILGHCERRKLFNESDELIKKKMESALKNNLKVILCVGETEEERNQGRTLDVIKKQLEIISEVENVIVSYEPVWSIGSDNLPNENEIKEVVNYIKKCYNVRVLYGGSVNSNNIGVLNKIKKLDGFLIGTMGIDALDMLKILEVTMN